MKEISGNLAFVKEDIKITLQQLFQFLATFACAIFAGAAIYINLVEHPARISCGIDVAIEEWRESYKRAAIMQGFLVIIGSVFAFIAWLLGANIWWLIGALLFGLIVPYTLIVVKPLNNRLFSQQLDKHSQQTKQLLKNWNYLHMIRSALGMLALIIFLLKLSM